MGPDFRQAHSRQSRKSPFVEVTRGKKFKIRFDRELPYKLDGGARAAVREMRINFARHWTLTGLAAELHLTPGHLVRLFNAATGLPPMAYLALVRAEQAAVLLHSDEPVTGIGRVVGWPDQNYFARRFKAHYGLSATTYRKRFATGAAHLHHPGMPAGP